MVYFNSRIVNKKIGKMDSFELNKIVAAILIALLITKGADLISNYLIHPKMLKENAFKIAGVSPTAVAGTQSEKTGPAPIEPLLAKANAQNGAAIFKKCTSCHTAEKGGPNKIGPDLYNVVNAEKGKHPGFTYSQAMEKKGGKWTYDDLNHFIYDPRGFLPGTKMSFAGLKNDQERADVIAYLRQQSDSPPPLPEVKATPQEGKPTAGEKPAPEAKPETKTAPEAKPAKGAKPEKENPAPGTQPAPAEKSTETKATPTAQPAPAVKPSPQSSSRNLENLSDSLDFLNIRDPEQCLNQSFPGSRTLRNPNPQLTLRERISKFRDDEFGLAGEVHLTTYFTNIRTQIELVKIL